MVEKEIDPGIAKEELAGTPPLKSQEKEVILSPQDFNPEIVGAIVCPKQMLSGTTIIASGLRLTITVSSLESTVPHTFIACSRIVYVPSLLNCIDGANDVEPVPE